MRKKTSLTDKALNTAIAGLVTVALAGGTYLQHTRTATPPIERPAQTITLEQRVSDEPPKLLPEAPIYSSQEVPKNYCSRYVRKAAEDLFNIQYPHDDAWKLREYDSVTTTRVEEKTLYELEAEGILKQGTIVGMHYPNSKWNGRNGDAGYTHVILFLGKGENGKLYFADKFGTKTRTKNLEELQEENHLTPIELISPNK